MPAPAPDGPGFIWRESPAAYSRAVHQMLREEEARADALIQVLGEREFSDLLVRRRRTARALEEGLLRRELIGARPAVP